MKRIEKIKNIQSEEVKLRKIEEKNTDQEEQEKVQYEMENRTV